MSDRLSSSARHLPYDRSLIGRAKELRQRMTPAEKKLWYSFLKGFPYRILRQRPIDHFIVDFYCAELRLVIEIDGAGHFDDQGRAYDRERSRILEGYGLTVVRFTNDQVLQEFDEVCRRLRGLVDPEVQDPPYPPY